MRLIPRIALCVVLLSSRLVAAEESDAIQRPVVVSIQDWMLKRGEGITIPTVEFREVSPTEALAIVRRKAKECDPAGKGMEFTVTGLPEVHPTNPAAATEDQVKVTLSLKNASASELLRYVAGLSKVELEVEVTTVTSPQMEMKIIPLPPALFGKGAAPEELGVSEETINAIRTDVAKYLRDYGVAFDRGASCWLAGDGTSLVVKNTLPELQKIAELFGSLIPAAMPGPDVPKWTPQKPDPEVTLRTRAAKLILRRVQFDGISLEEAARQLAALSELSRGSEPQGQKGGVSVLVKDWVIQSSRNRAPSQPRLSKEKVRYSAKSVSLLAVAEALAEQTRATLCFREEGVIFCTNVEPNFSTREYLVRSLDGLMAAPIPERGALETDETNTFAGVSFFPGASSIYLPASSRAIIRTSPEVHALLQKRVERMWREYYASENWLKEQKRQQRLRERGVYRELPSLEIFTKQIATKWSDYGADRSDLSE